MVINSITYHLVSVAILLPFLAKVLAHIAIYDWLKSNFNKWKMYTPVENIHHCANHGLPRKGSKEENESKSCHLENVNALLPWPPSLCHKICHGDSQHQDQFDHNLKLEKSSANKQDDWLWLVLQDELFFSSRFRNLLDFTFIQEVAQGFSAMEYAALNMERRQMWRHNKRDKTQSYIKSLLTSLSIAYSKSIGLARAISMALSTW